MRTEDKDGGASGENGVTSGVIEELPVIKLHKLYQRKTVRKLAKIRIRTYWVPPPPSSSED